jgi:uncharacterized protein (DUF362 family)
MSLPIDRRTLMAGTIAGAGCARPHSARKAAPVSIVRASYDDRIYDIVRRTLAEHAPQVSGRNVVLKPNLVEFEPESAINSNPLLVHAVFEAFRALGAGSVRIAEGPGHRRNTLDLADAAGYFKLFPDFEDRFIDLNQDEVSRVRLDRPNSRLSRLYLPKTALGADLLVSIPKMKTHHWAGVTLSLKNLFGVVPGGVYGWPKNVLHWAGIAECIADLHRAFPRRFAIVDGIVGMEGNGPIQGTPKAAGVIVAGSDGVAVDATCCRVMGIDPVRIDHLKLASDFERHIAADAIRQIGERIETVATRFELIPEFRRIRLAALDRGGSAQS